VEQAGGNHIVLVFLFHIRIRGHSQKFLGKEDNRFGVSHQTANTVGELGVILTACGSPICPKVGRSAFLQKGLDSHSQILVYNEGQLPFKNLDILHWYHSLSFDVLIVSQFCEFVKLFFEFVGFFFSTFGASAHHVFIFVVTCAHCENSIEPIVVLTS
jgi:hypothetical protein